MTWAKGQSGNPKGRPPNEINERYAVMRAICKKVGREGQEGVEDWLKTLPDNELAGLFGKCIPRDDKLALAGLDRGPVRILVEHVTVPLLPASDVEGVDGSDTSEIVDPAATSAAGSDNVGDVDSPDKGKLADGQ